MANVRDLEKDAVEFAERAINFDIGGQIDASIYYYRAAASTLLQAQSNGSQLPGISDKISEYLGRAILLGTQKENTAGTIEQNLKSKEHLDLERAEFLLFQGLEEDEAGNEEDAVELYSQAVELCIDAMKHTSKDELKEKLSVLARKALERAEVLKGVNNKAPESAGPQPVPHPLPFRIPPLGFGNLTLNDDSPSRLSQPQASKHQMHVSGNSSYSKEELQVLRITSYINGREYVPFMSVDLKERFAYPMPFTDKDGKLALAPKQKSMFGGWVRPEEISPEPKLIENLDCNSIKQTVISDCSFVSSLAVSSLYEKRFRKKIITKIIYPQNRNGDPVYNPCGKYMIKLHINGIPRKVIVDDLLPQSVGSRRELLCSYSSNRNEFWVSLLEKAYMKVMGGYDFPGSNSNIDLHSLTGWIPERVALKNNPDPNQHFNKEHFFDMLADKHRRGDVLTTVATGDIPESEADRAGLVPTHAYAVLDVRLVQGNRLLLLKNPWSHLRWKGKFSEHDTQRWTQSLMEALKYNPKNAQVFDNGVFWIDYESVCHFFDVAYLNWNPELFKYTYCTHDVWQAGQGPVKDLYNIGDNPQYMLEVQSGGAIWILLTRHITDRDDFADNQEYIAVLVYKNEGKKVYLPYDPPPYLDGVRINSPHYLCKLASPSGTSSRYTLVISQYSKMTTIYYTLRAFASAPFTLAKIRNPFQFKQEVKNGEWTHETAGGCGNYPQTYSRNPVYQINLQSSTDNNHLLIDLKGPKQYSVGFEIVTVTVNNPSSPGYFRKNSSGAFRSGFTIIELDRVPAGTYNIIPSTFLPDQRGPFFLLVQASCPIKLTRIK